MYDKLLEMMEDKKESVSFYARMEAFNKFLDKHDIYPYMYSAVPEMPVSFVWAISTEAPEVFAQQMGSLAQFPGIIQSHDQFIFVADSYRKNDVLEVIGNMKSYIDTKVVLIKRDAIGDRPTLNWDIGLDYAKHDRVMFMRDLSLFFQPWDFMKFARTEPIDRRITSLSTILGPVWSRFTDQWVYLSHPTYAPTPYLFAFVANKQDIQKVNGFDRVFSRGFDHSGELDFLLRCKLNGVDFAISDETRLLHPGIPTSHVDLEQMRFHSSVNRRYFMDRWGETFIGSLKPPFSLDLQLIEVADAHTLGPLMEVECDEPEFDHESLKDILSFAKRSNDRFIVEEL